MDVNKYLKRIGIRKRDDTDIEFLTRLQRQHLFTVPFENLDIRQGTEIVLDFERFYNKIVLENRGGFCYELNGLFGWLLKELRFDTTMISARAYVRDKNAFGNEFDHMALLVRLKKIYLVDVGFGDCFRSPLAMPDGMLKDISGFYRLTSDYDNGYQLQKIDADNWQPIYKFTETPRMLPDYEEMCFYHQTSPNTHFTQRSICTLATENGRISLSDSYLTVTEGNNKRKIPITSNAYYRKIMSEYFRINIEQVV